jgi:predicted metal-dependent peptidase
MMSFDLKLHAYRLLMDEPFFAALSRRVEKREDRSIKWAAVGVNPDTAQFEMFYNPENLATLPDEQIRGVLKHEFYHLIFDHVTSRNKAEGVSHLVWNICQDLAINSHLQGELPDWVCMPGQKDTPYEDLPLFQTAEWYLKELKRQGKLEKKKQPSGKEGDGDESGDGEGENLPGQFDDHSGHNDAGGGDDPQQQAANQMAKERLKNAMKDAAKEASQSPKGWGSISGELKKDILSKLESKVDWRKVLRYFIKTSQRASRRSSVKRINKRYAYIHPGKKVQRQAKIAIAIDQSGSVSDEMLSAFFSELNSLAKLAEFTVVPFDTSVDESKIYIWKKGKSQKAERVLCGGTCFDAPTKYVNDNNFDGVIILTDMEAPKPKACKAQRMWMTDARGASRPYFKTSEKVIAIDA